MSNRAELERAIPAMLQHEGWWDGWHHQLDVAGAQIEAHRVKTWCEFPEAGERHCVQHNWLMWGDGRSATYEFGGRLKCELLVWKTDRFSDYDWQSFENTLLLKLDRRDADYAYNIEMIAIASDRNTRSRTWQCFRP